MKRYKRIAVLLAVLAVACAATFAVSRYQAYQEEIQTSDEVILDISADSVTALSWTIDGETLSFHRDESWLYDQDDAFPVDQDRIAELLALFEPFGVSFRIENVQDYGQYGLDDPAATISLTTEDQTYQIKLGDFSQMDEERYVDIGDGNVYLVSTDPMDSFDLELSDLILNDQIPDFDQVSHITFAGSQSYTVTREEDSDKSYSDQDIYFNQQGEPLDTSLVDAYLTSLSGVALTDYVTYNATDQELESYGMADPELTITVDYSYTDDQDQEVQDTAQISIARAPDDRATLETADGTDTDSSDSSDTSDSTDNADITAYLRVGDSGIVYQISGDEFVTLMDASYNSLRHQQLFWGDMADVTRMDISLEGETHTIEVSTRDGEQTYTYQGDQVDLTEVTDALDALTAQQFTDMDATGAEEISLTLYLDKEHFPTVTIRITRYDGQFCLAQVDGESVALIDRADAMTLVEAVQAIVLGQSE